MPSATNSGGGAFGEPETWTTAGFVREFATTHGVMLDRDYTFVLGAGASVTSGIPTGGQLVERWLSELQVLLDDVTPRRPLGEWATESTLGIKDFEYSRAAEFYPEIYTRRFRNDPQHGYADLEEAMERAEPSFGYSVLAQLISDTRHRVVVTTNFDNLVADAISIYGSRYPVICGHESLAGFVGVRARRPVIAKIHRDLYLRPVSDVAGTSTLTDDWAHALRRVLKDTVPVVIGYGGNDGSLMGFLESLDRDDLGGRLVWCYRIGERPPADRIRRLVASLGGVLVPIAGFDELMLELGNELGYGLRHEYVLQRAEERAERHLSQVDALRASLKERTGTEADLAAKTELASAERAMEQTVERDNSWARWALNAERAANDEEEKAILRQGLEEFPGNPRLTAMLAGRLWMKPTGPDDIRVAGELLEEAYRAAESDDAARNRVEASRLAFRWDLLGDDTVVDEFPAVVAGNDPPFVSTVLSFAEVLLGVGRVAEAHEQLETLRDRPLEPVQDLVRTCLELVCAVSEGRATKQLIRRIDERLAEGARDAHWASARMSSRLGSLMGSDEDVALCRDVLAAMISAEPYDALAATLNTHPRWAGEVN